MSIIQVHPFFFNKGIARMSTFVLFTRHSFGREERYPSFATLPGLGLSQFLI